MKRLVAVLTVLALLIQSVFAVEYFADVDEATEQGQAIIRLAEHGVVNGMGNGCFAPDKALTRAQFVKIVNNIFGYKSGGENKFIDVSPEAWYFNDICIASEMGYINGVGDGCFAPDNYVTREQACVILDNILNMERMPYYTEPSDAVSDWARESVLTILSNRLITLEDGNRLRATELMTRGEACEMLEKCYVSDVGEIEYIDIKSIAGEELEIRMTRVINAMETEVIPNLNYESSKTVGVKIVDNMKAYLADNDHDYIKASQETFEIYKGLTDAARTEFKTKVQEYNKLEDLMLLYDFFFVM